MTYRQFLAGAFALIASSHVALAQGTRMLRHPTVSRDAIAFEYGGDLWVVPRNGGDARRLTSSPEMETDPVFSPDGSHIAFSRTVGGNTDVCVVSSAGGEPKRLTFHPGADRVRGWSPDGKRIIFATARASAPQSSYFQLFSVPADGGFEEPLPMPRAFSGTYSPDGGRYAYEEIGTTFIPEWYETSYWRHYRGGRTHPISVMTLANHSVDKLPWQNSNDRDPMWVGNTMYFVSDRNTTANLFSYRTDTKELKQLTHHDDFDVMTAGAGSGDALGLPHPRAYGNLVRVIAEYVKKRHVLTLEDAVRKMTSWPATRYRFANRGAIKEGDWADVAVFDLASLDDRATYEHPTESPTGIEWVRVNGVVTIDHGKHTGAKAGKVLYGPGHVVPGVTQ